MSDTDSPNCKYKVRLCKSYASVGWCPYGQRCQFAHGVHEIRSHAYKTIMCKEFVNKGTCPLGGTCTFAHGFHELRRPILQKRPIMCRVYAEAGWCPNGKSCVFCHGADDLAIVSRRAVLQKGRLPIFAFLSGC